jgi:hypothetical protein
MKNSDEILYLKSLKYILQYNCELVMSYKHQTATIFYTRNQTKEIPYELGKTLKKDERIELDSGNWEFREECFRRTEDWEKNLSELKEKYPNLFRKDKIQKLLKNS